VNDEQRKLVLIIGSVPCLFCVIFAIGYWRFEPQVPLVLKIGFLPAAVFLGTAVSIWIRYLWINRTWSLDDFSLRRIIRERAQRRRARAEHQAWLARIAVDPQRQRYYAMIQAGDVFWTPDRVEYDLDPHATACCKHLAPIEREMRAAGIDVKLSGREYVIADCRIDAQRLKQRFRFMEPAAYQEFMMCDRGADDPVAQLICDCRSAITVLHPQQARDGAPVFPSA
jgi:hypothetical protein